MRLNSKAVSLITVTAITALSACGDLTPDYESYKTANPYAAGIYVSGAYQAVAPSITQPTAEPTAEPTPQSTTVAAPTPGPLNIIPAPYMPYEAPVATPASVPASAPITSPTLSSDGEDFRSFTSHYGNGTGIARVNGEKVEFHSVSNGTAFYVAFLGKNGAPTALSAHAQAQLVRLLPASVPGCSATGEARSASGDVLGMIGGAPTARWTIPVQCP